ncbi:twin-arginine translocase TatA/TatE family subunit [Pseudomonas sp. BN417]|uniref:twin-arginine translocase TatA/TatE family subunit n=1 Tax=unclassified Pseudomonas TaxID=196821 RepID=UPI002453C1DA|nr:MULTISPECIES: twin-arginine translocase TatA/TatE family subunit [unclassified Pseudomonas]MDH4558152.1 twin-arginine translocase TatA/TatE family subunit [Pseudomonas sp. BN417]MDH4608541.1 twin-arginine translocase TatA/TatE family subunit [Pseudomonas sp. BN102]
MGIGGISIWKLLIILLILIMLFGTKRLKGLGSDLGETIKGLRNSMGNDDAQAFETAPGQTNDAHPHKIEDPMQKH